MFVNLCVSGIGVVVAVSTQCYFTCISAVTLVTTCVHVRVCVM